MHIKVFWSTIKRKIIPFQISILLWPASENPIKSIYPNHEYYPTIRIKIFKFEILA